MSNIIFKGLSIKVASPTKIRTTKSFVKVNNKIVHGEVIDVDGTYKIKLYTEDKSVPEILDFTPKSFEIVGRRSVFLKTKDETGSWQRIIRDPWDAKFHPGSTDRYTPFVPNWIVKGYVVKHNNVLMFDFSDLVGVKGYDIYINTDDD